MLSIAGAVSAEDFRIAAAFTRTFGEWDATQVAPYGIPGEDVIRAFHSETFDSLTATYAGDDAKFLIARWDDDAAGCAGFHPFDAAVAEIAKVYVEPAFRGRGIARALLGQVLAELERGPRRTVVLHTAVYMKSAISLYESFGFKSCERFRDSPENIRQTDHFMSRPI